MALPGSGWPCVAPPGLGEALRAGRPCWSLCLPARPPPPGSRSCRPPSHPSLACLPRPPACPACPLAPLQEHSVFGDETNKWLIDWKELTRTRIIGEGAFGKVRRRPLCRLLFLLVLHALTQLLLESGGPLWRMPAGMPCVCTQHTKHMQHTQHSQRLTPRCALPGCASCLCRRCGWGVGRRRMLPSSSWALSARWAWIRAPCSTTPAEVRPRPLSQPHKSSRARPPPTWPVLCAFRLVACPPPVPIYARTRTYLPCLPAPLPPCLTACPACSALPTCLPTRLPPCLPARHCARLPPCLPTRLPPCLPACAARLPHPRRREAEPGGAEGAGQRGGAAQGDAPPQHHPLHGRGAGTGGGGHG